MITLRVSLSREAHVWAKCMLFIPDMQWPLGCHKGTKVSIDPKYFPIPKHTIGHSKWVYARLVIRTFRSFGTVPEVSVHAYWSYCSCWGSCPICSLGSGCLFAMYNPFSKHSDCISSNRPTSYGPYGSPLWQSKCRAWSHMKFAPKTSVCAEDHPTYLVICFAIILGMEEILHCVLHLGWLEP